MTARQSAATAWSEAGHVVAWEQFRFPVGAAEPRRAPARAPAARPCTLAAGADRIEIRGVDFGLTFDRARGVLSAWRAGDKDLLTRPLEHSFLRARTDNDYIIGNRGGYYPSWVEAGLDRLQAEALACGAAALPDGAVIVRCLTRHAAPQREDGIVCTTIYTVSPRGAVSVEQVVDATQMQVATLPRIGMRLGLAGEFERLIWYGRGPHESYADRRRSALVGLYRSTVTEQFVPFVDPCECGGHEDTRWLRLENAAGVGVTAVGQPLVHFSALRYTVEDLIRAGHVYELTRTDDVQLGIDGFHLGLGGDTGWTPNVHPEYLLPPRVYRYGFTLSAETLRTADESPMLRPFGFSNERPNSER